MYNVLGFALLGVLVAMIVPAAVYTDGGEGMKSYGFATLALKDSFGNVIFENQVHNAVLDRGTGYMLNQTFNDADGVDIAEADQIDNLCVTDAASPSTDDAQTRFDFNTASGLDGIEGADADGDSCKFVVFTVTANSATTGAITFASGGAAFEFPDDTVVGGIGICQNAGGVDDDNCDNASNRILFAVVDTSNVAVGNGETVDITYTLTLD